MNSDELYIKRVGALIGSVRKVALRRLTGLGMFAAALLVSGVASSQVAYPNKPVRVVVPFASVERTIW